MIWFWLGRMSKHGLLPMPIEDISAIRISRFRFACFHSNFDISSVQAFLMSSDILCSVHVSSGTKFRISVYRQCERSNKCSASWCYFCTNKCPGSCDRESDELCWTEPILRIETLDEGRRSAKLNVELQKSARLTVQSVTQSSDDVTQLDCPDLSYSILSYTAVNVFFWNNYFYYTKDDIKITDEKLDFMRHYYS